MTGGGIASRFRRSHAFVIAIDAYEGAVPPLQNAVSDGAAIGNLLANEHGFEVASLYDRDATTVSVRRLIDELPTLVSSEDRVLLYFAGHGVSAAALDGPAGYLLLQDAIRDDPDSFLPMRELHDGLLRLECRHLLVVLDCCFAGTFRWASLRDIAIPEIVYRETFDRFVASPAWQVLTSAASDQRALDVFGGRDEVLDGHSPFATAMLTALAGAADLDEDGLITATELYLATRRLVEQTTAASHHIQSPGLFPLSRHERGEFVFQVPHRALQLEPAPPLTPERNPYRGLASYDERSRTLFFGRRAVVHLLAKHVCRHPLTVVVGPSGCGKSSIVAAGLVPMFRLREGASGSRRWRVIGPLRALDAVKTARLETTVPDVNTLVVIDQLEDLITQVTPEDRDDLVAWLARWIADAPDRVRIVVSVRSDFEPQLQEALVPTLWRAGRFSVPPMSQDQLRQAIESPASARSVYFRPATLVDRLVNEVIQMPGALPLLSFTLSELYGRLFERRVADRAIIEDDYIAVGGVARALTRRASTELDALVAEDPRFENTARKVFLRMIAREGGELARRRVLRAELSVSDAAENDRIERLIERFVAARLLVTGTLGEGTDGAYVEPAHDALIRGWERLGPWLARLLPEAMQSTITAATRAAIAWSQHGRRPAELWHADQRLRVLLEVADAPDTTLFGLELEFAAASARERVRARRRTIARLLMVSAALLFTTIVAVVARSHADAARVESEHRLGINDEELGRQLLVDQESPDRALPYLVEARELGVNSEALGMMYHRAVAWLGMTALRGHTGQGTTAVFDPAGTSVLTASRDGTARIWDPTTGTVLAVLAHDGPVTVARFDPDGSRVITASANRAQLWDARTGARLGAPLEHGDWIQAVAFSPDGRRVATASADHTARVWDANTGALIFEARHDAFVRSVMFSRSGSQLVTASDDKTARVWDLGARREQFRLAHDVEVYDARFDPTGERVLTMAGKEARVWSASTGDLLFAPLAHQGQLWTTAFSPDGTRIVTGGQDEVARIWDAATGEQLGEPLDHDGWVWHAEFSADSTRVMTGASDRTARVFDASTGNLLEPPFRHGAWVVGGGFSPDGSRIVTAAKEPQQRIWQLATRQPLTVPLQHADRVWSAAFTPDGTSVVTASADGTARVWSTDTGRELHPPMRHAGGVEAVAISNDGTRIATGSADHTARVWERATGAPLSPPLQHSDTVWAVTFVLEGSRIVTASADGTARLWDARSGALVVPALRHGGPVLAVASTPNGSLFATASEDHTARIWSARTGVAISPPLHHAQAVSVVAFSPDGTLLATAGKDNVVKLWSVPDGRPVGTPVEFAYWIRSVRFSADGTRIVAASSDKTARVWDARTGKPLAATLKHQADVVDAAFSRDGGRIVTASLDGTARIWDATTGAPLTTVFEIEHRLGVRTAQFAPNGRQLLTASFDGTAALWDVETDGGTMSTWLEAAARCTSYTLVDGALASTDVARPRCPGSPPSVHERLSQAGNLLFAATSALPSARSFAKAQFSRALAIYREAGREDGVRVASWYLAVTAALGGELEEARALVGTEADPGVPSLLVALAGYAHETMLRTDIALRLLDRALAIEPADPDALANRAEMLLALGQLEAARSAIGVALAHAAAPERRTVLLALAWAERRLAHQATSGAPIVAEYRMAKQQTLGWQFTGTKHVLRYGRYRAADALPVVELLTVLEHPISEANAKELERITLAKSPSAGPAGGEGLP